MYFLILDTKTEHMMVESKWNRTNKKGKGLNHRASNGALYSQFSVR